LEKETVLRILTRSIFNSQVFSIGILVSKNGKNGSFERGILHVGYLKLSKIFIDFKHFRYKILPK
jgi:hypothetical protein